MSAPTNIAFLPNPLTSNNKKLPRVSISIPQPECLYLSGSAFPVNLTAPNKEFHNEISLATLNVAGGLILLS